jgi:hypothetical protein
MTLRTQAARSGIRRREMPLAPRLLTIATGPAARWLLTALLLAYFGAAAAPPALHVWGAGLDGSWVIGLNAAHRNGLGSDIVWTYGPLGYLRYFDPSSGPCGGAIVYWIGMWVAWLAAAAALVFRHRSRLVGLWAFLLVAFVCITDITSLDQLEPAVLALALLALVESRWYRELAILGLGLLASIALLVKLNVGAECWLVFVLVAGVAAYRKHGATLRALRYAALRVAAGLLCCAGFYLAAAGSALGFFRYLFYGWQIASGFSQSMSLPGPMWQLALAAVSIFGLLIWLPPACDRWKPLLPGVLLGAVFAFFSFKTAMVRQDAHAVSFQFAIALASLPILVLAETRRDRNLYIGAQLASVLLGISIICGAFPGYGDELGRRLRLENAGESLSRCLHPERIGPSLEAARRRELAPLKMNSRFADAIRSGTIDAIPADIATLEANAWNWQPRPVLQSYSAYTPVLDRLNARHFESARAPRFVLLSWEPIDGHHPFMEDASAWPVLFERYDLRLLESDQVLLELRDRPRVTANTILNPRDVAWGELIPIPASKGILRLKADVQPSLYGAVRNALYRTDPVYMEATYASGLKMPWRTIWPVLKDGLIVSPLPRNLAEMACMFRSASCGERVTSVAFHAQAPAEFRPTLRVSLVESQIQGLDNAAASGAPAPPEGKLIELWRPGLPAPAVVQANVRVRPSGLEVHPTGIDPQLSFECRRPLNSFDAIVVRARFSRPDRIDLFFGRQVDGRGIAGFVPRADQWFDVFLYVRKNLYWSAEAGTKFRFDPASELGVGSTIEISSVWGFHGAIPDDADVTEFYSVQASSSH